ncbi:DUF4956 domain-containing protein [Candidatus Pelagibacter sp.]|jgi:uncharacterized membrane protein YhiD involved in acid resistance|nr:DUF4956 domain-containing protein [Candidatus Pelagibacter sp.]
MEILTSILIIFIGGFFMRLSLISAGQAWAKTYGQTVSFFLLPIITHIITKVIYGNIALSLGMIGALSIVRFRHPVKSALELITYFNLITIGIATSVNNIYALLLLILTIVTIFFIKFLQKYFIKKRKEPFYNLSFTEGIEYNKIEIISYNKIEEIEKNKNLKSAIYDSNSNEFLYRMSFENRQELKEFKDKIEKLNGISKLDVHYV